VTRWRTPARNSGVRAASQAWTAALVRPSTCPNRACSPVTSTNPVSHGSVRRHRIHPSSCVPSGSHRGPPNRVSSIPSTVTGASSTSSTAPYTTTARCTVGHDTRCAAATSDWSRPSSTATASAVRNRIVVRIPAGTWATCSVNVCRAQPAARHRQRRLRHCTSANSHPQGRSRGRVNTQSLPDVDTDPHTGQRAASGSSVPNCTILTPSPVSTTRSTARPSSPNKHDASSLRSTTARGSPLAAPEHSEDQGVAGRPQARRTGPTSGCPVKIEEPAIPLVRGRGTVLGTHRLTAHTCFAVLLIMFRLRPRLRGRPGLLAGWPAQGMCGEIWRR
jgi:hypothetical protein